MKIEEVFKNNKRWIAEKLKTNASFFDEMGKGQNPELLYIGCSDSRVTAEEVMGMGPWGGLCSQEYSQYGYRHRPQRYVCC